jgi:hypothetical protein
MFQGGYPSFELEEAPYFGERIYRSSRLPTSEICGGKKKLFHATIVTTSSLLNFIRSDIIINIVLMIEFISK